VDLIHKRCAGLDVHQRTVVACARIVEDDKVTEEVRTFETTTTGLLELSAWLEAQEITHVAMEATGVYWKPVWHILEAKFELILANAAHIKNVPGRKTDVKDATWIAEPFGPRSDPRQLRAADADPGPSRADAHAKATGARGRPQHAAHPEGARGRANIKLTTVVTDILGKSGRAVLDALVAGESDPEKLVALTQRLKAPREKVLEALRGRMRDHHRFLIQLHLAQVDA
jgi:transposase